MTDEEGAEWADLHLAGGEEEVKNAKSCQFHFKQAVNREAEKLQSSKSKFEFKRPANAMLSAHISAAYVNIAKFMQQKPSKRGILKSWLDWSHKRNMLSTLCLLPQQPIKANIFIDHGKQLRAQRCL